MSIKIKSRCVKEENNVGAGSPYPIRPFQRETLEAIKNSDVKIVFVEGLVGNGKSCKKYGII